MTQFTYKPHFLYVAKETCFNNVVNCQKILAQIFYFKWHAIVFSQKNYCFRTKKFTGSHFKINMCSSRVIDKMHKNFNVLNMPEKTIPLSTKSSDTKRKSFFLRFFNEFVMV